MRSNPGFFRSVPIVLTFATALLLSVPPGSGALLSPALAFSHHPGSTIVGTSLRAGSCKGVFGGPGTGANASTPAYAHLNGERVGFAVNVTASLSCSARAATLAGFLLPLASPSGKLARHHVSVNWTFAWNASSTARCFSTGFGSYCSHSEAQAWVYLWIVDLTNGSLMDSANSPTKLFLIFGSSTSSGTRNITMTASGMMTHSHLYALETFVRAIAWADGLNAGKLAVSTATSSIDMAHPNYGGAIRSVRVS